MNVIDRAIDSKLQFDKKIQAQTWSDFEKQASRKKIFLFGSGAYAGIFWKKYGDRFDVEGIIDNAKSRQGLLAGDFIPDAFGTEHEHVKIYGIDCLKKYDLNKVMVLITSTNCYEAIMEQLEQIGVRCYYVLLVMEVNERLQAGTNENSRDALDKRESYRQECENKYPICKKKILFQAFGSYSDHEKYITEQLLKLRSNFDIVWVVNNLKQEVPSGIRLIYSGNWKKCIYEYSTAYIWVLNVMMPTYIRKRDGQIYIQTKHWASITLKKFYLDAKTITDIPEDVAWWQYNGKCMDYIITGSDFDTESSRRGFDFHKQVIQIGSPRSDAMFRGEEKKEKISSYYKLDKNSRILLYAPTYRYQKNISRHVQEIREINLDYDAVYKALRERFGGKWYIMLRLHPGQENDIEKLKLPDYVIDVSKYEDGQELAAACDVMISDYSSIMFEPAFVKTPVFLFATDKKDYIDKEYDLLLDYDSLPFPIAESNEELIQNIRKFDKRKYEKDVEDFLNLYEVHEDGYASERAAQAIIELMETGEIKEANVLN